MPSFFERAGWGKIEKQKESKTQWKYELQLMSDEKKPAFSRHLEAGFLAGQFELLYGTVAEATMEKKRNGIKLHIHIDPF
ncbi:YslB family protein [Salicibibacter halophilus]|uniref:YslB family protein n=1 Tax=Salicibibacter halophilus TaxID=2502791 RepID=UPI00221FD200|nr:YslB family protein [Salicibibacter halophilus]